MISDDRTDSDSVPGPGPLAWLTTRARDSERGSCRDRDQHDDGANGTRWRGVYSQ
jgi:hypothetical protein